MEFNKVGDLKSILLELLADCPFYSPATLSGAIDVIVVEQENGALSGVSTSSPSFC